MRLALVVVAIVVGLAGCVTPSIPIPPPDPAKMTFSVTTDPQTSAIVSASLTYPPTDSYKGGVAYLYNRSQGHGVIEAVQADGSVSTAAVAATNNNQIVFSIENDDQTVSTCVLLKEGSPASYCP